MGSSGEPDKGIDATVGGLVWVRRRNGSWWPGQIVGLDESSESFLASPRAGTPIKLLGREDASVDWYNLEKSKRVKAFRCGEYDDCIEKAKLAAANSCKKAVKYARRDDAILHALEIESARQSENLPDSWSKMEKSSGEHNLVKELPAVSHSSTESEHTDDESSGFEGNTSSIQESFEDPNQLTTSIEKSVQGRPRRTPNDSEDDGTEGVKRMRGLKDLGMGIVSSSKRKRSQVAHVHEFLKKKSRRRTLTKVLESTVMVSVPVVCEGLPSPSELESNESNRSSSVGINNSDCTGVSSENRAMNAVGQTLSISAIPENDSSAKLFDVPFVHEERRPAGPPPKFSLRSSEKPQVGTGGHSSRSSLVETVSLGNEEFNESVSTSSGAADIDNISQRIEKGNSKWQSKGKRNSRGTIKNKKQDSRKTVNVDDESNANLDEYWGWSARISPKAPCSRGSTADAKLLSDSALISQRLLPYRQSRFVMNPKYAPDFPVRNHNNSESTLYEVNLEVKASHRPQRVPYISLMSKLTGHPIIGHPLTVEVLDEGSTDHLVSGPARDLSSSSSEMNIDLRENIFVSDNEVKQKTGGGRVPSKHLKSHRVSPVKSMKLKKNGPSSKKIRKLSSLTGFRNLSDGEKNLVIQKIVGPAVACVPLKVVFSRINASFKGSMRPPKRVVRLGNQ